MQAIHCPGAASAKAVSPKGTEWALADPNPHLPRGEVISTSWHTWNLFITYSPSWQLCVTQNLPVLIVPNINMSYFQCSDCCGRFPFPVTSGDALDGLTCVWSSLKLVLALLLFSCHPGLLLDSSLVALLFVLLQRHLFWSALKDIEN